MKTEYNTVYPLYWPVLQRYPRMNPILMTLDRKTLHRIHQHRGHCLFCPRPIADYTLSFCFQREIWVLYSDKNLFERSVLLASALQAQGAANILVTPFIF